MKHLGGNSSVFVSPTALAALKKKAAALQLPASKKQSLTGTGSTKSPFKTKGMDFSEVRQYQAGDDIRQIDWRVTAKYGKPFTKLYVDEKQRQVIFVCDLRSSMKFASSGDFKSVLVAKMGAFLAWIATQKGDNIQALFMLPELLKTTPAGNATDIISGFLSELSSALDPFNMPLDIVNFDQMLKRLEPITKKGSLVFIFSDFHDMTPESTKNIGHLSKRADISLIHIFDAMEEKMPAAILPISDGNKAFIADMRNKTNRKIFSDSFTKVQDIIAQTVTMYHLGYLPIRTDEPYLDIIARYCEEGHL